MFRSDSFKKYSFWTMCNQCNNPGNCAHNVRCLAMSKTIAIFVAAAVSAVAASPYTVASAAPAGGAFAIKNAAPIIGRECPMGWWLARWWLARWWLARWWLGLGCWRRTSCRCAHRRRARSTVLRWLLRRRTLRGGRRVLRRYRLLRRSGYYGGGPGGGGGAVEYCMQRFRSYNPNTGTYMGNDGRRHPCP